MNEFWKYLIVGGVNTAVCYAVYLFMLQYVSHNIAFTVDYVVGIGLSYLLQLRYVFKEKGSLKKFLSFPSVYIVQYLLGLVGLNLAVHFGVPSELALLAAIILPIPFVFVLSRYVLKKN